MYKDKYCSKELLNVTEEVVFEELHKIITSQSVDFCKCEVCLLDIVAISLNNLPPIYWGNRFEKFRPRSEAQKEQEAEMHKLAHEELVIAIETVSNNPHH